MRVIQGCCEALHLLRSNGWAVGAHNDYFKEDQHFTFWLFTNSAGRYIRVEGPVTAEDLLLAEAISEAQ
jgi:hypothetical protein